MVFLGINARERVSVCGKRKDRWWQKAKGETTG